MRPTIPQLRGWALDRLAAAGNQAGNNAADLDYAIDESVRILDSTGSWYGKAHDAATQRTNEEADHGREVRNALRRLTDEIGDSHRELSHAREYTVRAYDAVPTDFVKTDDGFVSHDDPEQFDEAQYLQGRIQSGLDELERLDFVYGARLEAIAAELAAVVNGQPDISLPVVATVTTETGEQVRGAAVTMDPDEAVTLLASMSQADRATTLAAMSATDVLRLVDANPTEMGNMSGVPFEVRAMANEINIRNALSDEQQKPTEEQNQSRISQLQSMLEPTNNPAKTEQRGERVSSDLDAGSFDDSMIERRFVAFSQEGNGHMVEMIGSMSPAPGKTELSGAAVYVPGTGTTLDGSSSNHNAAWNLAHETGAPVFLYMNGDFPVDLVEDAPNPQFAADMAPGLVS